MYIIRQDNKINERMDEREQIYFEQERLWSLYASYSDDPIMLFNLVNQIHNMTRRTFIFCLKDKKGKEMKMIKITLIIMEQQ
jgi:hypothetical protein